jgi:hypothetical protein
MTDQDGPATPTGVPQDDIDSGPIDDEQAEDRPENRPEDDVDVDVNYDDITSDPAADNEPDRPDPKVGF